MQRAFLFGVLRYVMAVIGGVSIAASATADSRNYRLRRSELHRALYTTKAGARRVVCGLAGDSWSTVARSPQGYKVDQSADTKAREACSRLLGRGRIKSAAQIPGTTLIAKTNKFTIAEATAPGITLPAVSGEPPVITSIPTIGADQLFFRPGVLQSVIDGTPSDLQCREVLGAPYDGLSSGIVGCFLLEGSGYLFQAMLSAGRSFCYLKRVAEPEVVDGGGLVIRRGSLGSAGIRGLFAPSEGSGAKVIKLELQRNGVISGYVMVRLPSAGSNRVTGHHFRSDLLFCTPDGVDAGAEQIAIDLTGGYMTHVVDVTQDSLVLVKINATLTERGARVVFDSERERNAEVGIYNFDLTQRSRAALVFTPKDQLKVRLLDFSKNPPSRSYQVTSYTGRDMRSVRFLSGAFRDNTAASIGFEYREPFYLSAPTARVVRALDEVDLNTDPFFTSTQLGAPDMPGLECNTPAQITARMDFDNQATKRAISICDRERLEDVAFCSGNSQILAAINNLIPACLPG